MNACAKCPLRGGSPGVLLVIVATLALGACTSLPTGPNWGEDATYRPGWDRVERSAAAAVRDPWVWAPLLGAGLVQIDNADPGSPTGRASTRPCSVPPTKLRNGAIT